MRTAKKRKQIRQTVCLLFTLLAVWMAVVCGSFAKRDALCERVIRQGKNELYMKMIQVFAPSVLYEPSGKDLPVQFYEKMFYWIPLYRYVTEAEPYATQMESEISYETILAREAADERDVTEAVPDPSGAGAAGIRQGETGQTASQGMAGQDTAGQNTAGEGAAGQDTTGQSTAAGQDITGQQAAGQEQPAVQSGTFVPNTVPVTTYSPEKLNDFDYLIRNFYVVDRTTTIDSRQLNAADLLSRSMKLTHDAQSPQILIYHTHSQERFADSAPTGAETSIVGVGEYLNRLLGGYGFHVLHHTGEYDVAGRDDAYAKAGPALEQILKENPGIEVVIDLHRDGVAEGTRLVTQVQGKEMASIMFFNGLSRTTANGDIAYLYNPYIQDNLAFSLQMQIAAEEYYPGFSRAVYLKGYRYNMHYCPKTLLVEVGAQTNTVQEAMNAMEPLADLLAKVLR